jgi:hypothetical protein
MGQTIQWLKEKGQTRIYKTVHRKLKLKQQEANWKPRMSSGAPKGLAVPAPYVSPAMLLLNDTNISWHGDCIRHQYTYINTNNVNKTWTSNKTKGN